MKKDYIIAILMFIFMLQTACQEEKSIEHDIFPTTIRNVESEFYPSCLVEVKNNMLVFQNKVDFDIFMYEVSQATHKAVKRWTSTLGVISYSNFFQEVIENEDSINNYFENLPNLEKEYWKTRPQIHSDIYYKALNQGVIKEIKEEDGNEYFDLNLFDKSVAPAINLDGLVMVEGKIFYYGPNSISIILDGDFEKTKQLKEFGSSKEIICFPSKIKNTITGYNWTQPGSYKYPSSKTRVKVWIEGHSESYGNAYDESCTEFLNCVFNIKAEAQKKNFWGNYVYTANYTPSFEFSATWAYYYRSYACDYGITYGCGLRDCEYSYFPSYNCSPNPDYTCPTSPYSASWPAVANLSVSLTPHGIWRSSPKFFSDAIKVNGGLNAIIDGQTFGYKWASK